MYVIAQVCVVPIYVHYGVFQYTMQFACVYTIIVVTINAMRTTNS